MPLEQQLLPAPELKEHYGDVTWLFVSRNFKDDVVDREALRTHDRFGITSWPQMIVFDPRDDRVLQEMPRDLKGFLAGLVKHGKSLPKPNADDLAIVAKLEAAMKLGKDGKPAAQKQVLEEIAAGRDGVTAWLRARELLRGGELPTIEAQLADPDVRERCIALERIADLKGDAAKGHTPAVVARLADTDEHLIVKLRAMRHLAKAAPAEVTKNAAALLAVANDPFRYSVLEVVTAFPDAALTDTLLHMFDKAGSSAVPSFNPNVLRMHAAKALGAVGDERAIESLGKVARRADVRNGLTGTVTDALAAIGARVEASKPKVTAELLASFPPDVKSAGLDGFGDRAERMLLAQAQRVQAALTKVTGASLPAVPKTWSAADREKHVVAVTAAVAR